MPFYENVAGGKSTAFGTIPEGSFTLSLGKQGILR